MTDDLYLELSEPTGRPWRVSQVAVPVGDAPTTLRFTSGLERRIVTGAPAAWWDLSPFELLQLLARSEREDPLSE